MTLMGLLQKVRGELPGCELTSIVSFESGLSLAASTSAQPNDAAAVDAFGSEVHRLLVWAFEEAGIEGRLDDIVLQGRTRTLVAAPLGDSGYFWHISTRADTTLGFTQAVMRKYLDEIEAAVSALVG